MKPKVIIFFDGDCSFCCSFIRQVMKWDKNNLFLFAPLKGTSAKKVLGNSSYRLQDEESLVVWSEKEASFYCYAGAVFKIFWLLSGWYKVVGWLCFFPFLGKGMYKFIAKRRHFFKKKCHFSENEKSRLLS